MKFSAALVCATFALFSVSVEALPYRRGDVTVFSDCSQDSDCQQGCCAFATGKCAGPGIAQTNGDGGCGFGQSQPNCDVATVLNLGVCVAGARAAESNPGVIAAAKFTSQLDNIPFPSGGSSSSSSSSSAPSEGVDNDSNNGSDDSGKKSKKHKSQSTDDNSGSSSSSSSSGGGSGDQSSKLTVFESCSSDSDCQQGCCAFSTGKCAGPVVAQTNGDGGCGRGNATPNCDVATLLNFGGSCISGAAPATSSDVIIAAARFTSNLDGIPFDQ